MLAIIAFVAIFSAIIIFFVNEVTSFFNAIVKRPWLISGCLLVLFSSFVVMYSDECLWLVISTWIVLLILVEWVSHHLYMSMLGLWFVKWLVMLIVSGFPMLIVLSWARWKKVKEIESQVWLGYAIQMGLYLGVIALLLFGIKPPSVM